MRQREWQRKLTDAGFQLVRVNQGNEVWSDAHQPCGGSRIVVSQGRMQRPRSETNFEADIKRAIRQRERGLQALGALGHQPAPPAPKAFSSTAPERYDVPKPPVTPLKPVVKPLEQPKVPEPKPEVPAMSEVATATAPRIVKNRLGSVAIHQVRKVITEFWELGERDTAAMTAEVRERGIKTYAGYEIQTDSVAYQVKTMLALGMLESPTPVASLPPPTARRVIFAFAS